jgi:hypothetical protein
MGGPGKEDAMRAAAIEVGIDGRRRRNVIGGEGMLTPERTFTWDGIVFKAKVTRVAPDHPVAESEFADLLRPAYAKDATPQVMRFLERRLAARTGARPRGGREGAPGKPGDRPYWWLGPFPGRDGSSSSSPTH